MDTDSDLEVEADGIFPRNTRIDAKGLNIACGGSPQARGAPRGDRASIRRSAPDDFNVRDCFVSFVAFCKNNWPQRGADGAKIMQAPPAVGAHARFAF